MKPPFRTVSTRMDKWIDEITSSKSVDRNAVLEEAALLVESRMFNANDLHESSKGRMLADSIRALKDKA